VQNYSFAKTIRKPRFSERQAPIGAGEPEDRVMQVVKQVREPFLTALLVWIAYRIARALAAMKPEHDTRAVSAMVARSGNPSGV